MFINNILTTLLFSEAPKPHRCPILTSAKYKGEDEYYNKVSNCPPVWLRHGNTYKLSFDGYDPIANWDVIRVYDNDGRYLTWIPYRVSWSKFWEVL